MSDIFKKSTSWFFKDKKGKVVIAQFPNWQLASAGVAWLVQFVVSDGAVHDATRAIFIILLSFWAYEEIVYGVNGFRRILGLIVMASIYLELFRLLEAT